MTLVQNAAPARLAGPAPVAGIDSRTLAAELLARHTRGTTRDVAAIGAELRALAARDPALAAEVRGHVERELTAVQAGELAREVPVVGRLNDGTAVRFADAPGDRAAWLAMAKASADPNTRALYGALARAAGSEEPAALNRVLDEAYARGASPEALAAGIGAGETNWRREVAEAIDAVNPVSRLQDLLMPSVAGLARQAGLGGTEWGARLQAVLDSPGGLAAFRQGLNEGLLTGAQDLVTGVAGLAGRLAQHGADTSVAGTVGDAARGLTGALPSWLDAVVPSAQRGRETDAAVARFGENLGTYVATRAADPGKLRADLLNGLGTVWESVKGDHAKAAAKGPAEEARWFGEIIGRVTFEAAGTLVPVAGVAGKLDKAADAARVAGAAADGVSAADKLGDATKAGKAAASAADEAAEGAGKAATTKSAGAADGAAEAAARAANNRAAVRDYGIPDFLSARQAAHVPPVPDGRSVLTADPARLLRELHEGAFTILRQPKSGQVVIDFGRTIGENWGQGGRIGETQFGFVLYGKKGAHIVPANPNQW